MLVKGGKYGKDYDVAKNVMKIYALFFHFA